MELVLTLQEDRQVNVACVDNNGQIANSHSFKLDEITPNEDRAGDVPHPMNDPIAYGKAVFQALFPDGSSARNALAGLSLGDRILLVVKGSA